MTHFDLKRWLQHYDTWKNNNPEYADININENWIKSWQELDPDLYDGIFETEEDEETDEMDTEDQPQISHETNENISADFHQSDATETHISATNAEEEEDIIAMEENCKLRDLPYDTCLQSELLKKQIKYSQLHQEKEASQYPS